MSFDLTSQSISDTFQNVTQITGSDNSLYKLDGTLVEDLRISGSLTAHQYIVSSSVTNISIATISGSTNFGDSTNDTHIFIGDISSSGAISASGGFYTDGSNYFGNSAGDKHRFTGSIRVTGNIQTADGDFYEDPTGAAVGSWGPTGGTIRIGHSPRSVALNTKDELGLGWNGLIITQSRVGIGTEIPSTTLEVEGDISGSGTGSFGRVEIADKLIISTQTIAAAGSNQATSTLIDANGGSTVFVTGADNTKGVRLPVVANSTIGQTYTIFNTVDNKTLEVYPGSGDKILPVADDTGITIAASGVLVVTHYSADGWVGYEPAIVDV